MVTMVSDGDQQQKEATEPPPPPLTKKHALAEEYTVHLPDKSARDGFLFLRRD